MTLPAPETLITGIELVAVGPVESSLLGGLYPGLSRRFETTVTLGEPIPLATEWLDTTRNQYRAGPILDVLVDNQRGNTKTLGVVDADIFAPDVNFIFGQAIVGGCCALIGLARLRPEFYHKKPSPKILARRILIEAVHELGHTGGLDHCRNQLCVMHFSRTIQDSDRKGPDFCPRCRAQIR